MITAGIIVFSFIIIGLVLILLFSESKLMPKGLRKLKINDDESLTKDIHPGHTLLSALSANDIFIPSACGGGGTCGVCRCKVIDGGGEILPTETAHINRKEAKNHVRLACQVKVKEDIHIELPEEIFNIKQFNCKVLSNNSVSTYIKELVLQIPDDEKLDFKAGGYIQIVIPEYKNLKYSEFAIGKEYHEEWDHFKMWDIVAHNSEEIVRAYSMANHPAEGNIVMLNVRVCPPPWDRNKNQFMHVPAGISSSYIFNLKEGDTVTVSGPYGEFFIKDTDNEMLYIGGGAGMAPLRSHLFHLFHTLKTGRKVSYWYGARSKREIFYEEHFKKIEEKFPNFTFNIALSDPQPEDNWTGFTGFIHNVVHDNYLKDHKTPEDIEYYMCGPQMMSNAVNNMLYELGVEKNHIFFDDFGS